MSQSHNILLLDLGNSRLKWAVYASTPALSLKQEALASGAIPVAQIKISQLKQAWQNHHIQSAYIAAVGQEKIQKKCSKVLQKHFAIQLQEIHTGIESSGVKNSYSQSQDLGVDRWLCLLAVHSIQAQAAIVISMGTATTIDLIDAKGQHQGGYIIPGMQLMQKSLGLATAADNIQPVQEQANSTTLANSTHGGIANGVRQTHIALIEQLYQANQALKPVIYITGGAAEQVTPFLTVPYQLEYRLVFQGMLQHIHDNA